MLISSVLEAGALLMMGALGTAGGDKSTKEGIVAMLLLYSFSWSLGWAPLTYVMGSELPAAPLREYTLQIAYTVKLVTEYVPTGLSKLSAPLASILLLICCYFRSPDLLSRSHTLTWKTLGTLTLVDGLDSSMAPSLF